MKSPVNEWFAVDVTCEPSATEAIEFAFNELGALGTEIDSLRKAAGQPLLVSGYFGSLPDAVDRDASIAEAIRIYGLSPDKIKTVATRAVEQADWLAEWKKHWKPTEIGKFIVTPPWETVENSDKITISIEPNMAFGTGTHETTQLCLKAIGDIYRPERSFLDVGTGTGILAIAAAKLNGRNILACDTDVDSVKIARENAVLNGVGERIDFFEGSIDEQTPSFDLVCANLTADVILPLLDLLIEKTRVVLLLSGILATQESMVVASLKERKVGNYEIARAGEWISILVRVG